MAPQRSDASLRAGISSDPGGDPGVSSDTGFLTVSFVNLTGSDLGGIVSRVAGVNGFSSAIPEPETYAMMVAGLGLLGFMLRRRRNSCKALASPPSP